MSCHGSGAGQLMLWSRALSVMRITPLFSYTNLLELFFLFLLLIGHSHSRRDGLRAVGVIYVA